MLMKFAGIQHPCIVYELLDESHTEYKISVLGWVPRERLEETERHDMDVDAIDLAIELTKEESDT
jgi:hypothetical protein